LSVQRDPGLLTSNEQQSSVHHSSTVQHGSHKNVVTGAIHEAHMSHQSEVAGAVEPSAGQAVVLAGCIRYEAGRARALGVVTLVDFGVGIT